MVHDCVIKSQAVLCEWPTSSAKAHQEFSRLALSPLSPPPPSFIHTLILPLSLFLHHPFPLSTIFAPHSSVQPVPFSPTPHAFMLSTIHADRPPSVVSEAKSEAQALRLLEVASLSHPYLGLVRNYAVKYWLYLLKWAEITSTVGSVDKW